MIQNNKQEQDALLDIIGLLYDTPNNPKLWPELLQKLDVLTQTHDVENNGSSNDYIEILTPHLQRAITINNEADHQFEKNLAISGILDQLPIGVILVDTTNAPVTLNRRAQDYLKSSPFLRIEKEKLVAKSPKDTGQLYRLIKRAHQGETQDFLMAANHGQTCALHIMQASKTNIKYASGLTAIFITDTDAQHHFSTDTLIQMLQITEAEALLLSTLLDSSHNLSEAANTLQISKHTARNQMKSILGKTKTSSQSELLKKCFRSRNMVIKGSEAVKIVPNDSVRSESNNTFNTISLHDGGKLEYTEYGDPSGVPVVYFHGIIHSRQQFHPFSDYAETHGIRIIAPERPRFGATSRQENMSLTAFATNIKQLTNHLNVEKFYVLGEGNGGASALACAAVLTDQVMRASVVACVPDKTFDQLKELLPFERQLHNIKQKSSIKLSLALSKTMLRMLGKYDHLVSLMSKYYYHTDKKFVQSTAYRQIYQESMHNALPRNTKGFIEDYFSRSNDWDFQIQHISAHVDIWHGDFDPYAKIKSAKAIAKAIPTHTTHFLEDQGHYIFFSHADSILEQLIGNHATI